MAKKKVLKVIKLQIPAGKANPAPPIGPALGAAQVNIMDFCKKFNEESLKKRKPGEVVPVIISVYADKTFDFIMLHPPVADLIKSKIGIEKGSGVPNRDKVGKLTETQVREIAEAKAPDMRAVSPDARIAMVRGTARSMGVEITEG